MKLGFCSYSALDRPLAAAAEVAAGAGLDGLEVTAHPPHLDPEAGLEAAREAGRAVRAAGVEVICYGSYLGRFGRTTLAHARQDAEIAAALDTKLMRVWAEPIEPTPFDMAPVVELMRAACDAAAPAGITVVIERHMGSFADTPERIAALLSAIDRSNVALNYQVLDFLPADAIDAQPADAAALVRFARYFHLKNYLRNPDPGGPLFPGGSLAGGALDYAAILRSALAADYDGPLTFEFLAFDERPTEVKLADDVAFVRGVLGDR